MNIQQLILRLQELEANHGNLTVKHISYQVAGSSVQTVDNAAVVVAGTDRPVYVILESFPDCKEKVS